MESTKSKDDCSRIVLPKDLTARLDFIENNEAHKRCYKEEKVAKGAVELPDDFDDLVVTGPPENIQKLNLDKLAYAVAVAETGDCTTGMGVTKNNCFGIMTWPNGVRTGKWYPNKEASYEDFKRIWKKSYKRFPDYYLADKWTGGDSVNDWLTNVRAAYYK